MTAPRFRANTQVTYRNWPDRATAELAHRVSSDLYLDCVRVIRNSVSKGKDYEEVENDLVTYLSEFVSNTERDAEKTLLAAGLGSYLKFHPPEELDIDCWAVAEDLLEEEYDTAVRDFGVKASASGRSKARAPAKKKTTAGKTKGVRR